MKFHNLHPNEQLLWENIPNEGIHTLGKIQTIAEKLGFPEKSIDNIINALCWKNFLIITKYYSYRKAGGKKIKWNHRGTEKRYRMKFNKNITTSKCLLPF